MDNSRYKFRAWDKTSNEMLFFDGIFNTHPWTETSTFPQYESCPKLHDVEIMQYTGLKDKNGKEIYENDIVKGIGQHEGQSAVFYGYGVWQPFSYLGTYNGAEYEIIGNVYENPELGEE